MYTIVKRFVVGADIWVSKLSESDPVYSYSTLEEAEAALEVLKSQYPNNELKISDHR